MFAQILAFILSWMIVDSLHSALWHLEVCLWCDQAVTSQFDQAYPVESDMTAYLEPTEVVAEYTYRIPIPANQERKLTFEVEEDMVLSIDVYLHQSGLGSAVLIDGATMSSFMDDPCPNYWMSQLVIADGGTLVQARAGDEVNLSFGDDWSDRKGTALVKVTIQP